MTRTGLNWLFCKNLPHFYLHLNLCLIFSFSCMIDLFHVWSLSAMFSNPQFFLHFFAKNLFYIFFLVPFFSFLKFQIKKRSASTKTASISIISILFIQRKLESNLFTCFHIVFKCLFDLTNKFTWYICLNGWGWWRFDEIQRKRKRNTEIL